jgi:hypothetical protein
MKVPLSLFIRAVAIFALAAPVAAFAQGNNPLISVFENGTGTITFPGGSALPLPGVLAPDPGPGGLSLALTFDLLGPPNLLAGDLHVFDPGSEVFSDIIRFNPAGTGSAGYPASLVFYSISGEGALADTGFPTGAYTNIANIFESAGGDFTYTPTANQPGYVGGFSVTYHVTSGPVSMPDGGATLSLLASALGAMVLLRRRIA